MVRDGHRFSDVFKKDPNRYGASGIKLGKTIISEFESHIVLTTRITETSPPFPSRTIGEEVLKLTILYQRHTDFDYNSAFSVLFL